MANTFTDEREEAALNSAVVLGTTLQDTADLVRAIAWPVIVAILCIVFWPFLRLAGQRAVERGFKLGLPGGASFELPGAPVGTPSGQLAEALNAPLSASQFQQAAGSRLQSGPESMKKLLGAGTHSDYLELNLRDGTSWLSSRLYLVAIVFERVLGVRMLIFTATSGGVPRRFVGLATPLEVRRALRSRYPWLESAWSAAYTQTQIQSYDDLPAWQAVNLIQAFLSQVQLDAPPSETLGEWTALSPPGDTSAAPPQSTYEHATWMSESDIHLLLGQQLSTASVSAATSGPARVEAVVAGSGDYVASVNNLQQLEGLIDRRALIEKIARSALAPQLFGRP